MKKDISTLYEGHEVACHSYTHPTLTELPSTIILEEILRDKQELEQYWGHVVRGMAYPNGQCDERVARLVGECGIKYSRASSATSTNYFKIPQNFLIWSPTCHHDADIFGLWEKLVTTPVRLNMPLMYICGHSYEFDLANSWERLEEFCKTASNHPDVWYATNAEIYDYVTAQRMIEISKYPHLKFLIAFIRPIISPP